MAHTLGPRNLNFYLFVLVTKAQCIRTAAQLFLDEYRKCIVFSSVILTIG